MKRCLVTGSTGFIGSRLVKYLGDLDYEILVVSRRQHPEYKTIICDFETDEIPKSSFTGVDIVFHLAALSQDDSNNKDSEHLYNKVNVQATMRLAEASVLENVKKFIFLSSVKAGGTSRSRQSMNENNQSIPDGIYGQSKRTAELELKKIVKESNMNLSIIRPALVYGPDVKGNLGKMINGIKVGWFPPLPETGNCRSMIHVDDLVRAIMIIVKHKHDNGEIFIATDTNEYSARKIYEIACFTLDKPIPKWCIPKFLFDLIALTSASFRRRADKIFGDEFYSSKKLQLLGFKPNNNLKDINHSSF